MTEQSTSYPILNKSGLKIDLVKDTNGFVLFLTGDAVDYHAVEIRDSGVITNCSWANELTSEDLIEISRKIIKLANYFNHSIDTDGKSAYKADDAVQTKES